MAIFLGYVPYHVLIALQLIKQLKPIILTCDKQNRNGNNARLRQKTTEFPMLHKHLIGICLKYNEPLMVIQILC